MSFLGDIVNSVEHAGQSLIGEVGNIAQQVAPLALTAAAPELGLAGPIFSSLLGSSGIGGAASSGLFGALGGSPGISSGLSSLLPGLLGGGGIFGGSGAGGAKPGSGGGLTGLDGSTLGDLQKKLSDQLAFQKQFDAITEAAQIAQTLEKASDDFKKDLLKGLHA